MFKKYNYVIKSLFCSLLALSSIFIGGCSTKTSSVPEVSNTSETPSQSQVSVEPQTSDFKGQTLNLYVAAGLKKPMDNVIEAFKEETGAEVLVNYSSSGSLFAQIKENQPCDLYYSADWLYIEKVKEIDRTIDEHKFLKDKLVLAVSSTGESKISKIEDLENQNTVFVIGDGQAPVGAYAEAALKNLGLWDKISNNLKARPSTVNQIAIMIKEDQVDAGLIYSSVANGNSLKQVAVIDEKDSGEIIFGAASIKDGNQELAQAFMEFADNNVDEFTKFGWEAYQ